MGWIPGLLSERTGGQEDRRGIVQEMSERVRRKFNEVRGIQELRIREMGKEMDREDGRILGKERK